MTGPPGPVTSPAGWTDQAAEAVRALNHATLPRAGGLIYPADAYSVLAGLALLTARLPQALSQTERFLAAELVAGRIVILDGPYTGHPDVALAQTREYLHAARAAAGRLHVALDHAAAALVWAAAPDPEDGPV